VVLTAPPSHRQGVSRKGGMRPLSLGDDAVWDYGWAAPSTPPQATVGGPLGGSPLQQLARFPGSAPSSHSSPSRCSPSRSSPSRCSPSRSSQRKPQSKSGTRGDEKILGTGNFGGRLGSGRFYSQELSCFKRTPTPSPLCGLKAESYWQGTGEMRRALSDSGLHGLPTSKGNFWKASRDDFSFMYDRGGETFCLGDTREPALALLPLEDMTADVLNQIYPSSPMASMARHSRAQNSPDRARLEKVMARRRTDQVLNMPQEVVAKALSGEGGGGRKNCAASLRILQFRQKLLEKFSNMKVAFDSFISENGGRMSKELGRKEFSRFLTRNFAYFPKEEHELIFDFLDHNKDGCISMSEFHTAIEAVAPVRTLEDLRRKWIALGFKTMRQGLSAMDPSMPGREGSSHMSRRLNVQDFCIALCRVGIQDEDEHESIFSAICNPNRCSDTVSIDELGSALAAVSPSLVLEDLREVLLKRDGSLQAAYDNFDLDGNGTLTMREFMSHAVNQLKIPSYEALKLFRIIDGDNSQSISRTEFMSALLLSEPSLFLEEVRRKVRQRFRSIRDALLPEVCSGDPRGSRPQACFMLQKDQTCGESGLLSEFSAGAEPREGPDPSYLKRLAGGPNTRGDQAPDKDHLSLGDFQSILQSVQLTDSDTQILFDLIDIDEAGKLTAEDFVKGVRLFAPSCALEDLRLRCLRYHATVADTFSDHPPELQDLVLDIAGFQELLEALDLASGIDVLAVFDIVESRREGGVSVSEIVSALQSAMPGVHLPLPPEQRDARARHHIRCQMAPFHRSATELRVQMRQKLDMESMFRTPATSADGAAQGAGQGSGAGSWPTLGASKCQRNSQSCPVMTTANTNQSLPVPGPIASVGSRPQLRPKSPEKVPARRRSKEPEANQHRAQTPVFPPARDAVKTPMGQPVKLTTRSAEGKRVLSQYENTPDEQEYNTQYRDASMHPNTKSATSNVTRLLRVMPTRDSAPILQRLHTYFANAGQALGSDVQLLSVQQKRMKQFQVSRCHRAVLEGSPC